MTGVHRIVYFCNLHRESVFRWMVLQLSMTRCYHGSPMIFTINRGLAGTGLLNRRLAWLEQFLLKAPWSWCVCMSGSAQVKDNLLASVCIYKPLSAWDSERYTEQSNTFPPAGKKGVVARSPFPSCVLIYRNTPRKTESWSYPDNLLWRHNAFTCRG